MKPGGGSKTVSRWLIQQVCSSGSPASSRPGSRTCSSVRPNSATSARLDVAAELERHRLHAVTDAEHRDAELEQLRPQRRRVIGVDRRRAAGQHQAARAPRLAAPPAARRAAAARRRRRTRGSGARSAASTARRSRGPGPPRCAGALGRSLRPAPRRRLTPSAATHPAWRPPPLTVRSCRSSPCRCAARAGAACPRSAAPERSSPRRGGMTGCPRSRTWPSRSAARRTG